MIVHSLVQLAVNIVVTNHPTHSRVVTPQPRVTIQQPAVAIHQYVVTVPQPAIMVSQQAQYSMWMTQNQNLSNVPIQSLSWTTC